MDKSTLEPYLLSRSDDSKIFINQPKFTIGRSLTNSLVLEDLQVSRTHCLFEEYNGVWCLTDLSSNGTALNKQKIPKEVPQVLSTGDIVTLNESLEFVFVSEKKDSLCDVDFSQILESSHVPVVGQIEVVMPNVNDIIVTSTMEVVETSHINDIDMVQVPTSNVTSMEATASGVAISEEHTYCTNTNDKNVTCIQIDNKDKPSTSSTNNIQQPAVSERSEKKLANSNTFDQVEDELQCIICTELFVKATTLNCSHSFCKHCIEEWQKKNKKCPICRTKITTVTPTIVLDNFISKVLETATEEIKTRRAEVVKSREKQETVPPIIIKAGKVLRGRDVAPIEISSDDDNSYNDDDDDEDEVDDDEFYNGVPGAYYGGYGHCFTCGDRGHWANGCPYR